jgi:curved DNA-binding protein CbpA
LKIPNYYELLQINPNAEPDTVHRVYRFLAARFHPDNPDTGDADKFAMLKQAYDVLQNPVSRAEYDMACSKETSDAAPLSSSIDFMDSMEGELNRRLAVLALLYFRRRSDSAHPHVSLFEVESRMGFPREYLEFTIWYLQKKQYIVRADNSDFTLTADGVDFVETQRANIPVLNRLLTSGASPLASNLTGTPIIVSAGSSMPEGTSVQ